MVAVLAEDPDRYPDLAGTRGVVLGCDTTEPSSILRRVQRLMVDHELVGLGSGYEGALTATAVVAQALGLSGPMPTAAWDTRFKPRARALSNEFVGNAVPFWLVYRVEDVVAIDLDSFPVVAKPAGSGGSLGVEMCKTSADLYAYADRWLHAPDERGRPLAGPILVERMVGGREFSVEVFNGTPVALTSKLVGGPTGFVELGHTLAAWDRWDERHVIGPYLQRLVQRLDLTWGPVHIELRLDGDLPRLVEVNYRLPGGRIPGLVRLATGVDLYQCTLQALRGQAASTARSTDRFAAVRFITAQVDGRLSYSDPAKASAVRGVHEVGLYVRPDAEVHTTTHAGERLGHVVSVGNSMREASDVAEAALAELNVRVH
jgi:biotin carboxylase